MIKNLLMLLIIALIGWVVYATFFGNQDDLERRNKLLGAAKELGESVADIFKSESEKVKDGTYSEILTKLDKAIGQLKEADDKGNYSDDLKKLLEEKARIEKQIEATKGTSARGVDPQEQNTTDLKKLAEDIKNIADKMKTEDKK